MEGEVMQVYICEGLELENELLGVRFHTSEGVLDIEIPYIHKVRLEVNQLKSNASLYHLGGLLKTQKEINGGLEVINVSEDEDTVNRVLNAVKSDPRHQGVFKEVQKVG